MKARVAKWLLRLVGWRCVGDRPVQDRFVLACAPHTSNWDLVVLLLVTMAFGIRVSWIGKHTLFRGPLGGLMHWLGGVPVDRNARHRAVESIAQRLRMADRLVIAICPEGTRSRADYWKSGFYRIAEAAAIPIVLGFVNYERREAGFAGTLWPSGDVVADMDLVRAAFADAAPRYPSGFGPIRLPDEDPAIQEPAA